MNESGVAIKICTLYETLQADTACKWPFSSVDTSVSGKVSLLWKPLQANIAWILFLKSVNVLFVTW